MVTSSPPVAEFRLPRHQQIQAALNQFDADFLRENRILFGGGTRISMELDEFRESVDIDFLCPDRASYRCVREEVTNLTLGALVKSDFSYIREIQFDRYSVRTFIDWQGVAIKLEIVSCDEYELTEGAFDRVPVPVISRESCYVTKLLANADRGLAAPYKDIVDILAMVSFWGAIPEASWQKASNIYGRAVRQAYTRSLHHFLSNIALVMEEAQAMGVSGEFFNTLVVTAKRLEAEMKTEQSR